MKAAVYQREWRFFHLSPSHRADVHRRDSQLQPPAIRGDREDSAVLGYLSLAGGFGAGLAKMHNAADESTVLMISFEWRVQGIEFALSAEGEQSAMFPQKAIKCFILAGDDDLVSRATAQLDVVNMMGESSMRLKIDHKTEQQTAAVLLSGLMAGLLREGSCTRLCVIKCSAVRYLSVRWCSSPTAV